MDDKNLKIVFATVPDESTARKVAEDLVTARAAACVNIVPGVRSIYRWEGKVEESTELLLIIKTIESRYQEVERRVKSIHPYQVPEVISCDVTSGLAAYCSWVREETAEAPDGKPFSGE